MKVLTAIDLFAGAGGLSSGLVAEGFKVVVAVENDPTVAKSYNLNHPDTTMVVNDIRNCTGPQLLKTAGLRVGELDLLTGCPPCQGFSTLRTKRRTVHATDPRNDLITEVLRLARSIRPRAVILENVPGLASNRRFLDFQSGLHKAGYRFEFSILNAADFGLPQRRKRLVLVALKGQAIPNNWSHGCAIQSTVKATIENLPKAGSSGDTLHDFPEKRTPAMLARIKATPKDGGSRRDIPAAMQCPCHSRSDGYKDVYGRMAWNDVAPTITGGCINPSRGRFLHPEEDRAITLREAALLQTFPPNYQFCLDRGKDHVARQIGNAFPPDLIRPIAKVIRQELVK